MENLADLEKKIDTILAQTQALLEESEKFLDQLKLSEDVEQLTTGTYQINQTT